MKKVSCLFLLLTLGINAQKKDTITINAADLVLKNLNYDNSTYLLYNTKGKDLPMQNATLVKINTEKETFANTESIVVRQVWEADTIIHKATTRFAAKGMKTLTHNTWWKRKGYTENYDFTKPEIRIDGNIKDEVKAGLTKSFDAALKSDFLNWHSDLVLFPLLPLSENRIFKINFYEPGYSVPKPEVYEVIGNENISYGGSAIDCWVLNYKIEKPSGYQRFWISKKTHELLKEEDNFGGYSRYKIKLIAIKN